jgi:ribosome biogenesis GTPase
MKIEDLGYNERFEEFRIGQKLHDFETGRIISEHKERYVVRTTHGDFEAEITGNMRFAARSREDFPAVGDWVSLMIYEKESAIIHKIFPRYSVIKRQSVGKSGDVQIIASNIDYAFLVQAADRDFNINRIERYLTMCYSSGVKPVIILTKTDLVEREDVDRMLQLLEKRHGDVQAIPVSNETESGYDDLWEAIKPGKTYCMLGSSGVGKSTLLNNLYGRQLMKTGSISHSTSKGRHVTSHRELTVLGNGGIIIDNPGMREVGIADTEAGLEETFNKIVSLSADCKYADCTHTSETGCAVLEALENGELDRATFENYLKMEREKAHFESTAAERKKKDKILNKIVKDYYRKDYKRKKH